MSPINFYRIKYTLIKSYFGANWPYWNCYLSLSWNQITVWLWATIHPKLKILRSIHGLLLKGSRVCLGRIKSPKNMRFRSVCFYVHLESCSVMCKDCGRCHESVHSCKQSCMKVYILMLFSWCFCVLTGINVWILKASASGTKLNWKRM